MQAASIVTTGTPAYYGAATATPGLGADAFLQLLVAQFRYQDPFSPMDDKDFIAQLAQLNTLEQLKQLNQGLEHLLTMEVFSQAAYLLGKEVQAKTGAAGTLVQGLVSEVRVDSGVPILVVDGQEVRLTEVISILEPSDDNATS